MQARSLVMDAQGRRLYMQAVQNAILTQFLTGGDFLKGGAALQLSYPLRETRASQDVDAVFADSARDFERRMTEALTCGWQGFTGTVKPLPHREHTLMPKNASMSRYRISLLYLGKPFSSFYMEAVPDINGAAGRHVRRMDGQTRGMLAELGFDVSDAPVMDPLTQLAEKLHAVSRPGKTRGRDLADIALMVRSEDIDMDSLRSVVDDVVARQGQHAVHALDDADKNSFIASFSETGSPIPFEDAWNLTQRLLTSVEHDVKGGQRDRASAAAAGGDVWVGPHIRDGRPVSGYWRRRPSL